MSREVGRAQDNYGTVDSLRMPLRVAEGIAERDLPAVRPCHGCNKLVTMRSKVFEQHRQDGKPTLCSKCQKDQRLLGSQECTTPFCNAKSKEGRCELCDHLDSVGVDLEGLEDAPTGASRIFDELETTGTTTVPWDLTRAGEPLTVTVPEEVRAKNPGRYK